MGSPFDPTPVFNPQSPFAPIPVTGHPWDDPLAPLRQGGEAPREPNSAVDPREYRSYAEYQDALSRAEAMELQEIAAREALAHSTAQDRSAGSLLLLGF